MIVKSNFLAITGCALTVAMCPVAEAPGKNPAAASDSGNVLVGTAGRDDVANLRAQVDELTSLSSREALAGASRPVLESKAHALRETYQAVALGELGAEAKTDWVLLAPIMFELSLRAEWKDEPQAEADLRHWLMLAESVDLGRTPAQTADAKLSLYLPLLRYWVRRWPVECDHLIEEAEARWRPAATIGMQRTWLWWISQLDENLHESGVMHRMNQGDCTAVLAHSAAREDRYWNSTATPLAERTCAIAARSRTLYTQGETGLAVRLLDSWRQRHAEALLSPEFCSARFFAGYVGQGDVEAGRNMLHAFEQMLATGVIANTNSQYQRVLQTYYKHLPLSEPERLMYAAHLTEKGKKEAANTNQ